MAFSRQQQRAALREDAKRRNAREIEEFVTLHAPSAQRSGIDPYLISRGITGVPSAANRNYSASDDCWKRGMRGRTVGLAPNTADTSDGTATVLVITADGDGGILPASHFRPARKTRTRKTRTSAVVAETARINHHHDFNN